MMINFRRFGLLLLVSSLFVSACGSSQDNDIEEKLLDLSKEAACSRADGYFRCDVSLCDEGCTIFVKENGDGRITPVATCPEDGMTVDFEDHFTGDLDILCRAGDEENQTILLGHEKGEEVAPTPNAGNDDGNNLVIAPKDKEKKIEDETIPPTADDNYNGIPNSKLTPGGETKDETKKDPPPPAKPDATLTAKIRPDQFGGVNLAWNVTGSADQIQDLYLWSQGGFNRLPKDGSATQPCGENDGRYLIVDPATGLNFNDGSPNASAVKALLMGNTCNTVDCVGAPTAQDAEHFSCRMDLKKDAFWRTSGQIATIAGFTADQKYTLVVQLKDGSTIVRDATVTLPTVGFDAGSNGFITLDKSHSDAFYARVQFHYSSLNPYEKITVESDNGIGYAACPNGLIDIPSSGKGQVDVSCLLKDNTKVRVVIPGYKESFFSIKLGKPIVTVDPDLDMKHVALSSPTTTAVAYHVWRTIELSYEDKYDNGKTNAANMNSSLTDGDAVKTLKSTDLLCYSYATDSYQTCGQVKDGKGLSVTNVPLSEERSQYKVRLTTADGTEIISESFGYLVVSTFSEQYDYTDTPKYFVRKKIYDDATKEIYTLKMQHVKSISWKCYWGATLEVSESDGSPLAFGYTPSNSYEASFLTATMMRPKPESFCAIDVEVYYNVAKYKNGMEHVELGW